jgi:hypothetical protein
LSHLDTINVERGVSIEMKRREHVKSMMFSESGYNILFEGNLGKIRDLSMEDNTVLELRGDNGILRVDLSIEELESLVSKVRSGGASGSKLGSVKSSNGAEVK